MQIQFPKSIITHSELERMFCEKYPQGKITLSKDCGGTKRRYAVSFTEGGKIYTYSLSAAKLAEKLNLLAEYTIVSERGEYYCHWNKSEMLLLLEKLNSAEYAVYCGETAIAWGSNTYVHPVYWLAGL